MTPCGIFHINLCRFCTLPVSGIGDREAYFHFFAGEQILFQLQIRIGKSRIGQPKSEGITHRYPITVIITISGKNTLPVLHIITSCGKGISAGCVIHRKRESFRQFSTGILFSIQQLYTSLPCCLSCQIHM